MNHNDFYDTEWKKSKKLVDVTVALFGTCGGSKWRDPFIAMYERMGISYYNPVVPNWTPECAVAEAKALEESEIILFPVTGETYGFGSLGEIGFAVAQVKGNRDRALIVYVDPVVSADDGGIADFSGAAKASGKARALVRAHLAKVDAPNVIVVNSLEQMLNASIRLHDALRAWQESVR